MPLDGDTACSGQVIDAAMRVHSLLGPGLLESAYEACLAYELRARGLDVRVQVPVPIDYGDVHLEVGYRADMIVESKVMLELKAVASVLPIHEAQLLSYLKLSRTPVGLLINFHELHLKDGITRLVNGA